MADTELQRLLGGRTPAAFLRHYWHRKALLVQAAMAVHTPSIGRRELFALATRDDVASRLVQRIRGRYTLEHGPFRATTLQRLPARDWTLLIQGVNLHSDAADALLRRFAFIPYARLDDVMVSHAAPGGGVGPHYDSYDVFLLQGEGRRRWRYGRQSDLALRRDTPLRILRHFTPQHEAIVERGDMLYVPPNIAHDGTAIDACTTYSIGFRAPLFQELAEAFLDHLRDTVALPGRYDDADLRPTYTAARIDRAMQRRVAQALRRIRFTQADVARFLGRYLSEPPQGAVFASHRTGRATFRRRLAADGVRLDRRTQLLYDGTRYYLNGDDAPLPAAGAPALRRLADRRALTPRECAGLAPETIDLLHDWERHGFLAATG